jgi:hypothetical protein
MYAERRSWAPPTIEARKALGCGVDNTFTVRTRVGWREATNHATAPPVLIGHPAGYARTRPTTTHCEVVR